MIIQKNDTKVALYGLSHIHDARLARLYRDHKVSMMKPDIDDDDIFNMMVLHQNRAERGRLNYLPEDQLPGFLDLVIWGHEHDCRIEPEENPRTKTYISQPGSSVATSLSEGEAIEKHVGILEIHKREFKMLPVKLQTVRPLVFRSIYIDDLAERLKLSEGKVKDKVGKYYAKLVEEMIEESKAKITRNPKQPKVPLIRLRVVFTNDDYTINIARFGQQFHDRVANADSVIRFKKQPIKKARTGNFVPDDDAMRSAYAKKEQQDTVEDVVESFFAESQGDDQLKIFNLKTLTEICRLLVKDDGFVQNVMDAHFAKAEEFLLQKACADDEIVDCLKEFQSVKSIESLNDVSVASTSSSNFAVPSTKSFNDLMSSSSTSTSQASTRGGKTTRGRAAATSSTRATSSRASKTSENSALNARSTATQPKSQRTATRRSTKAIYVDDSDED